jgi:hypothetical protein
MRQNYTFFEERTDFSWWFLKEVLSSYLAKVDLIDKNINDKFKAKAG